MRSWVAVIAVGLSVCLGHIHGAEMDLHSEIQALRKQVEALHSENAAMRPVGSAAVDRLVDNRYGPDAMVTTRQGKLRIAGLLQVWYYSIENDNLGFFGDRSPGVPGGGDTNEGKDNDSYAIRRARMCFSMHVHENVQAFVQLGLEQGFSGRPSFDGRSSCTENGV